MQIAKKYLVFRWILNEWNLVHMNVETLDIALDLMEKLRAENPKHYFRIIAVTEEVVYQDLTK